MSRKQHSGDFFSIMEQEEYVWAMRTSVNEQKLLEEQEEEMEDEDDEKVTLFDREEGTMNMLLVYKTTILASFVPDEIIFNLNDYTSKTFDASILCGDVSGFTELCETYNQIGSGGPSRLTDMLNNFIGAMVQEIMSHGGDVIKFSGDAFLALWRCSQSYAMRDYIQEAINCALVIQKSHNNFITDVGVTLRVKLAISSGAILFSLIGDSLLSHYIEVGQPILDTKDILEICHAGDIIISEKAYAYVDVSAYLTEEVSGGKYIRIFGVGASWRQIQKFSTHSRYATPSKFLEETDSDASSSSRESLLKRRQSSEFALRPMVNEAATNAKNLYEHLKKFIIPPVMQRIELDEPLEHLTELRQITVIMINIVPHSITFDSLIGLVKRIYRIITIHIQKFSGCINKVSCFDKDLMCVLIFGLRGLKQDLECRNALRCAGLIYEDIYVLSKVKGVSIGVSTGKTYCGVFGHTLRREYTVIGLTVNKAARLMVAYPDKVTCCNETFINCKMRETYFEQQKYVYLKGIKNPGPVYEFKYSIYDASKMLTLPTYPILGRDDELKLYNKLLTHFLMHSKNDGNKKEACIKMLVLEGEAKSGKTRLGEEFLYTTPTDIPIQIILAENEVHEPYNVLRQMYFSAMGIAKKAPRHTKQETLQFFLTDYHGEDLCALNEVFDSRFPMTENFQNFSGETKVHAIATLLQYLASVIFTTPKIFIIERMMIMDELTWQVIPFLLKIRYIFIVGSMRPHKKSRCESRRWIYTSKRVKFLKLKKIDKMFYAALACQMIEVEAIPPDLENAIQSRSNGNPGWIKNLLICLQQAEAILIKNMTYAQIYRSGLVAPPLYMMKRLNKVQLEAWKQIMEEKSNQRSHGVSDPWFKYVDSCRDSFTDISVREVIRNLFSYEHEVKACIIAPGFQDFTKHSEQSQEIVIIKTFDSLLYTEQLVVKCGSVLGWQFSRSMLEYVMGDSCTKREKAEGIQKLFENRIFACSRGDFTEAGEYAIIRTRDQNDLENQFIECYCQGLDIPECCRDLPKYASCGYLHFRSNNFLEATYNLLPEAQKIEFHQKAAKYLEKNTRKCRACGNGFFEELTGKMENHLKFTRRRRSIFSRSSYDEEFYTRSYHSDIESFMGGSQVQSEVISADYSPDGTYFESFGVITPKKLYKMKEHASLTRTFSMYDFSGCECKLILNYMYGEVSRHYRVAGQYDQMLKAMLAHARSCMNLENTAEAFITLDAAEAHIKSRGINPNEPQWKSYLLEGNIFALRGRALLQTNQVEESNRYLLEAMEKYGAPFPKLNFARYLKSYSMKLKQKLALYFFPDTLTKQLKHYEAVYFNDVAECLHTLSDVFFERRDYKQIEFSSVWALHCALKANYEFKTICQCFTHMIYLALMNCNTFHCLALEIHSLRYCHKKVSDIDSDDLKYVAELYQAIRKLRCVRSEMEKSIYIGYSALRLAISVKHLKLIIKVIPRLVFTLMVKSYLPEACSLLNELDYYSSESDCNSIQSGRLSFFTACLKFQIETGYTVLSYNDCEKFNYTENLQLASVKNPTLMIEFVSLMWLWNCRNHKWECAAKWTNEIRKYVELILKQKERATFVALYILEGHLLSLVHSTNSQNIESHEKLEISVNKLFKKIQMSLQFAKFLLPRFKHFQAYYEYIKGHEEKALKMLEDTLVCAAKYENALELVHINHSKLAWKNQLTRNMISKWNTHSDSDHLLDYRLLDGIDNQIISFTLPKPIYD